MLYLLTQIILALVIAFALGWFMTKLLYQSRKNELLGEREKLKAIIKSHEALQSDQEQQLENLKNSIQQKTQRVESLIDEKHQWQGKVIRIEKENQTAQEQIQLTQNQLKRTRRALSNATLERDSFKDRLRTSLQKYEFEKTRLTALNEDQKKTLKKVATIEGERNTFATQALTLNHEKEGYHGQLKARVTELNTVKQQLKNIEQQRDDYDKRLRAANVRIDEFLGENNLISREKETAALRNEVYKEEITDLKSRLDNLTKERDELRIRLFTIEELTSQITSPMKEMDFDEPTELNPCPSGMSVLGSKL